MNSSSNRSWSDNALLASSLVSDRYRQLVGRNRCQSMKCIWSRRIYQQLAICYVYTTTGKLIGPIEVRAGKRPRFQSNGIASGRDCHDNSVYFTRRDLLSRVHATRVCPREIEIVREFALVARSLFIRRRWKTCVQRFSLVFPSLHLPFSFFGSIFLPIFPLLNFLLSDKGNTMDSLNYGIYYTR